MHIASVSCTKYIVLQMKRSMGHTIAHRYIWDLFKYFCLERKLHVDLRSMCSTCRALGTLCPPCSHFTSTGVIAADLPHDLKPFWSYLPTSWRLFAVVQPSISCSGSWNEVPMGANKTGDNLDTRELFLLNTSTNGTCNKTEFSRENQGTWKEKWNRSPWRRQQEFVFPHAVLTAKCSTTVSCSKDVIARKTESPEERFFCYG